LTTEKEMYIFSYSDKHRTVASFYLKCGSTGLASTREGGGERERQTDRNQVNRASDHNVMSVIKVDNVKSAPAL